jgi:hypothetical protein
VSDAEELAAGNQANRFDIRCIIGGAFAVCGLVLTLLGSFGSEHIKTKAAGINIDLWTGIGGARCAAPNAFASDGAVRHPGAWLLLQGRVDRDVERGQRA